MLRGLSIWSIIVLLTTTAGAVDFRIETKVYSGDEEVPVSQNTTLFQNGVVYDFQETTNRVAIFRRAQGDQPGRYVLLETNRSIKTEFSADRIDAFIEKICVWARAQRDPLMVFHASPNFTETFDDDSGVLTLSNPNMTYQIETKAISRKNAGSELRNYFDAYAKLNCWLGSPWPPMPRLELNKALSKHKVYPVEVSLTIPGSTVTGEQDMKLRAEHTFTWLLKKDDRARIELVGEQLVSFRDVSAEEFKQKGLAKK